MFFFISLLIQKKKLKPLIKSRGLELRFFRVREGEHALDDQNLIFINKIIFFRFKTLYS